MKNKEKMIISFVRNIIFPNKEKSSILSIFFVFIYISIFDKILLISGHKNDEETTIL